MGKDFFQHLTASLKEGGAILRGNERAAGSRAVKSPDASAISKKIGLSQFAARVGISPRTLQNLEQSHRHPEGTAPALLSVDEHHPEVVLKALHGYFVCERFHSIDPLL